MKKYLSIMAEVEQWIQRGRYAPGSKLPSIRKMANMFQCSTSTVIRAFAELEKNHVIYSIAQSGHYVVEKKKESPKEDKGIDFSAASPDLDIFPYLDFQHCLNQAIDRYKYNLFTYGDSHGLKALRDVLVSHLWAMQVFTSADGIFITSGSQQALMILSTMQFPAEKKTILVEQPSYDIYLKYLKHENIPMIGIARDETGIDLNELEYRFKHDNIKFFYTMPRSQNPLGTSYNLEQRKAIASLAHKYDVYIVEDDYIADLNQDQRYDPIYTYDQSSHVIYLKSFSKIIFPGLRLGVVVLPESLRQRFHAYKKFSDIDTSALSQAALAIYIKNGMFEKHRYKIRALYAKRMEVLHQCLAPYWRKGLVQSAPVDSGIFKTIKLPVETNLKKLVNELKLSNILVVPGEGFYLPDYREKVKFIRLSIARAQEEEIAFGVDKIIHYIKRYR
ncbi:PLP-dependent aminotransferase family protein [Desmospora activa]|uniref:DNA-binding transcriptional MocR family regulator n=1 Tax=Desmospora activa DSM 45169 TaxID=1121389 RepID=A0A2T4ZBU3_9BACL|nr:PLP-dependent aminotransferase family protein [Desmospora activa]PTM59345.1 DNA-binding transcriptional MocR family regulator [Desmospora activa DSM 45169]